MDNGILFFRRYWNGTYPANYCPTIYHDFLEKKGEGLHHLGFYAKDMDKRLNMYKEMNIEIIQHGEGSTSLFTYLNAFENGGIILELIQSEKEASLNIFCTCDLLLGI